MLSPRRFQDDRPCPTSSKGWVHLVDVSRLLQVHTSWAEIEERAIRSWRTNVFGSDLAWSLETVDQFDEAARFAPPEAVRESVRVSPDIDQDITWRYADLGFDRIYLHHVGQEQSELIRALGERVIPVFNS